MLNLFKFKSLQKKLHGDEMRKVMEDHSSDTQFKRKQLFDTCKVMIGAELSLFSIPHIAQLYRITLHPSKLARLKYKCLIGIVGLLECNEDSDNLILRIVRSIPLYVMTENLYRVFVLFERFEEGVYEQKVLNRSAAEIDTSAKDAESGEMILEIGFQIYNLLQMFLASKKGKVLQLYGCEYGAGNSLRRH